MASHNVRAGLDKKPNEIQEMFDHVAPRYDLLNTIMTGGQVTHWRRLTAKAIDAKPGQKILDLAAGTGASSVPLAAAGAQVVACDLSEGMLAEGRLRHPELEFVLGDALDLQFEDNSFDAVTISYGIRNVEDTHKALQEMLRVTKPGGRVVVAEMSTPAWAPFRLAYQVVLPRLIPMLGKIMSSNAAAYHYLAESVATWPGQEDFGRMFLNAGWDRVEYRNLTGGIAAIHRAWKDE